MLRFCVFNDGAVCLSGVIFVESVTFFPQEIRFVVRQNPGIGPTGNVTRHTVFERDRGVIDNKLRALGPPRRFLEP